jgi:nitrilase
MSNITVAIVQQPPSILDLAGSVERAANYVTDAARQGASLIVFPETWLTCYPAWVFGLAGWRDPLAQHWYARLLDHSVVLDHTGGLNDGLAPVREAARDAGVTVTIGVNERPDPASGSVYNSLVIIGDNGATLNLHRKLTPTHTERIVWAAGDGAGLRAVDTPVGRVGGLICWEHFLPLARHAMHVQHEEVHVAVWPDMPESHQIASRSYALEGRCHVISAAQIIGVDDVPDELRQLYRVGVGPDAPEQGYLFNGGSHVVAPDGSWVLAPVFDQTGILTATFDTDQRYSESVDLDVAGHYARPDVFQLRVDVARRDSGVRFSTGSA